MELLETKRLLKHFVKLVLFSRSRLTGKEIITVEILFGIGSSTYCCISFLSWLKGVTEEPPIAMWKFTDLQLPF